ncbi:NADH-quinone oxidoreductase subunit H [Brevirhabdus sp.]|uniref:NADH-quinone oxidoreductase subunit H n=1 Tax=Brevirhabdus sp. TaxID=2004514 RepID=UPI00405886FA
MTAPLSPALVVLVTLALPLVLLSGAWLGAVLDRLSLRLLGSAPAGGLSPLAPLRAAAQLLTRQSITTEAPDRLTRAVAPVLYLALAAIGMSVVPFAPGAAALVETPVGIVVWGSCEALIVIAVFLHGWSPNAPFPLIGAYRYAAIGLPIMLPSMFVLIAAALPAQSLSVSRIVASQAEIWNVVRQPLGLPLFILVGLTLTLRGPFDYADSADLAGGTSAEESGADRALWQFARLAMLTAFSVMAAAVFLGGPLGPVLPGPAWLLVKAAAVMAVTVMAGHIFALMPPSRMLSFLWVVILPLSFLHLLLAGLEALA